MSTIHILQSLVARSRQQLINAAASKARKREMDVPAALDNWQAEKKLLDPKDDFEQERVINFLIEDYNEKFLFWSRHVILLRSEEKRGWS